VWLTHHFEAGDFVYEDDEYQNIVRARLAIELHKLPSEIDTMSYEDIVWVSATLNERQKAYHG